MNNSPELEKVLSEYGIKFPYTFLHKEYNGKYQFYEKKIKYGKVLSCSYKAKPSEEDCQVSPGALRNVCYDKNYRLHAKRMFDGVSLGEALRIEFDHGKEFVVRNCVNGVITDLVEDGVRQPAISITNSHGEKTFIFVKRGQINYNSGPSIISIPKSQRISPKQFNFLEKESILDYMTAARFFINGKEYKPGDFWEKKDRPIIFLNFVSKALKID